MLHRTVVALLWLFLSNAGVEARAATPASQPSVSPGVAGLIAQLDSNDWHARQSAEDALVAAGEPVRESIMMLRDDPHASVEAHSRAEAVLKRLDDAAANAPTRVTIHMANASPRAVFAELSKQAKMPLPLWPEQLGTPQIPMNPSTISVDADVEPFWDLMTDVCGKAGVYPHALGGNFPDLVMMQGGATNLSGPRSSVDPRFTIVAQWTSRSRQVGYLKGGSNDGNDSMHFSLFVDPKVTVISAAQNARLTAATDDHGRSMLPKPNAFFDDQPNPFAHGHQFDFDVTLALPEGGYDHASLIKGTIGLMMPTRTQRLVIDDVAHHVGGTTAAGGCAVEVRSCMVSEHNLSYVLAVSTPALKSMGRWGDRMTTNLQLVDADGHTFAGGGAYASDGVMVCQCNHSTSEQIRQPIRLEWTAPEGTQNVAVPFEFHNLPLPRP